VRSDDSDEHVREVARYVDQEVRRLAASQGTRATLDLVLLTALNIASEYWKLQQQQEEMSQTINRLSQRVLARLGREGGPGGKENTSRGAKS
jgi:cell division protein ZapA